MAKKETLGDWFAKNKGTGWVDCNTGKPCGRRKGEKRKKYPACRPTMAQCNSAKRKKKGPARISWQKKSTGGIMSKKFGMGDGMQNSYEKHMESVIEKNMKKQNKLKLNEGGFIAKGCGAVMKPRKKVTTIS